MLTFPSERRAFVDPATGAEITQWTSHSCMHHHFYFTNPTASADLSKIFGLTYRNRYPNIMAIDTASSEMRVLTEVDDLNPFSPTLESNGLRLYYSARSQVRSVDVASGKTEVLADFASGKLGNCSLSHDGRWLAVSVRAQTCRLMLIEVATGKQRMLVEKDEVGHIQFNPRDASILEYSGPLSQRIWVIRSDGSGDRLLYPQRADEWLTHESWSADGSEVIFTSWPHALRAVDLQSGAVRDVAKVNAWHAWSARDGSRIVADTCHPDRGLLLIHPRDGSWQPLCHPKASCKGTQWTQKLPAAGAGIDTSIIRGDDPAKDLAPTPEMPASTYGPQWTHPHPTFSTDGSTVIYTSDQGGWSQIYSVRIPV